MAEAVGDPCGDPNYVDSQEYAAGQCSGGKLGLKHVIKFSNNLPRVPEKAGPKNNW